MTAMQVSLLHGLNYFNLGFIGSNMPLYTQLHKTFSLILWKDYVHRFLNFGFFSPRLLQSCNDGPEN